MKTLRVLILSTATVCAMFGATITESETNGNSSDNTIATAQAIPDSAFTLPAPAGIFGLFNAAVIQGFGGGEDVDFYSFHATGPIQLGISDNPFTFSTIISLFDSSGDLLGYDDSSAPLRSGSVSTNDSYFGSFTLPAAGTYYVSVSSADASLPNYPDTSSCADFNFLTRPDGGYGGIATTGCGSTSSVFASAGAQPSSGARSYTLVIAQTPEPQTLGLLALGLVAVAGLKRWKNAQ